MNDENTFAYMAHGRKKLVTNHAIASNHKILTTAGSAVDRTILNTFGKYS